VTPRTLRAGRGRARARTIGRLILVALAAALGLVTGCGGGEDSEQASAKEVVDVSDRPRRTTPLAQVREATIPLPGGPDWLTSYKGFVWVKRDDGFVTRLDPRTNKPRGEVRADTKSDQFCQGIGSGEGAVWSCSGSDVVRIDPKTLKVVASIPVGKIFDQGRLVVAAGHLWVLTGEGDRLTGVDAATNRAGPEVKLPFQCVELGPGSETLWVVCPQANRVLAIDVAARSIKGEVEVEAPSVAVGTDTHAWVGSDGRLVRIDTQTLEPVARFSNLDPGDEGDVAVDGDVVWVRTVNGFLHRIDARSNVVAAQIRPGRALSGGSLLVADGSVWTTAFDDNIVLHLRPRP
jgi:streptogramin lyase